jgi:hypothetical protein
MLISNTYHMVGVYAVTFYMVKIYIITFYSVCFLKSWKIYTVTFYTVKFNTGQNLNGSKNFHNTL